MCIVIHQRMIRLCIFDDGDMNAWRSRILCVSAKVGRVALIKIQNINKHVSPCVNNANKFRRVGQHGLEMIARIRVTVVKLERESKTKWFIRYFYLLTY